MKTVKQLIRDLEKGGMEPKLTFLDKCISQEQEQIVYLTDLINNRSDLKTQEIIDISEYLRDLQVSVEETCRIKEAVIQYNMDKWAKEEAKKSKVKFTDKIRNLKGKKA